MDYTNQINKVGVGVCICLFINTVVINGQQLKDMVGPCTNDRQCQRGQYCEEQMGTCEDCDVLYQYRDTVDYPSKCKENALDISTEYYGGCKDDIECGKGKWCYELKCHDCAELRGSKDVYEDRCPQDQKNVSTVTDDPRDVNTVIDDPSKTLMANKVMSSLMASTKVNGITTTEHPLTENRKPVVITTNNTLHIAIMVTLALLALVAGIALCVVCRCSKRTKSQRGYTTVHQNNSTYIMMDGMNLNTLRNEEVQPHPDDDVDDHIHDETEEISFGTEENNRDAEKSTEEKEAFGIEEGGEPSPSDMVV
ncbi:uncharacterized protein LOC144435023 [Glandiceps talaboti]